jgi:hypothetical protein
MATCYVVMGRKSLAEELLRSILTTQMKPDLICVLGTQFDAYKDCLLFS